MNCERDRVSLRNHHATVWLGPQKCFNVLFKWLDRIGDSVHFVAAKGPLKQEITLLVVLGSLFWCYERKRAACRLPLEVQISGMEGDHFGFRPHIVSPSKWIFNV
jgi:hypothetical protein